MIFEVDTGSYLSTINKNELINLPNVVINETLTKAKAYGNSSIRFLGETELDFQYQKNSFKHTFLIVGGDNVSLLGRDLCAKLNIKLRLPEKNIFSVKNQILSKYEKFLCDDFQSNVTTKVEIELEENAKPIFCKARSVPLRFKALMSKELQRLENVGVISKVMTSSWASPTVCVLKPNNTVRIVGDYSKTINKFMKVARYPLPSIDLVSDDVTDEAVIATCSKAKKFTIRTT